MSEENSNTSKIIWAFGERSKYAHAYPGEKGMKAGLALCATRCVPIIPLHHWDFSRKEVRELTCPVCMQRLHVKDLMSSGESTNE